MIQELEGEGWEVVQTKKHLKIYSPDGKMRFTAPVSPSDRRAFLNARAEMRRAKETYETERGADTPTTGKSLRSFQELREHVSRVGQRGVAGDVPQVHDSAPVCDSSSQGDGSERPDVCSANDTGGVVAVKYYYTVNIANKQASHGYSQIRTESETDMTPFRAKAIYVLNSKFSIFLGKNFLLEPSKTDTLRLELFAVGKDNIHLIGAIQFNTEPPLVSTQWKGDAAHRRAHALDAVLETYGADAATAFGYEPPEVKEEHTEEKEAQPPVALVEIFNDSQQGITIHTQMVPGKNVHIVITGPGSILMKLADLAKIFTS